MFTHRTFSIFQFFETSLNVMLWYVMLCSFHACFLFVLFFIKIFLCLIYFRSLLNLYATEAFSFPPRSCIFKFYTFTCRRIIKFSSVQCTVYIVRRKETKNLNFLKKTPSPPPPSPPPPSFPPLSSPTKFL